ncbi:hypothetical protein KUCAC02_006103 [Chaenocephalus aceratus]|uniref:Uncharacterized protein n=2 Tax=Chaenocephalus aceratus TaxID=36190 RepID=A0ACB9WQC7_CHAAC|nr:hypothetical protein KUCAC02_005687 [Chaenocephalus aceratus]KAI4815980.1 hypothetical protein KUCAC02_006103 [Chaenocephalus aceratus]
MDVAVSGTHCRLLPPGGLALTEEEGRTEVRVEDRWVGVSIEKFSHLYTQEKGGVVTEGGKHYNTWRTRTSAGGGSG